MNTVSKRKIRGGFAASAMAVTVLVAAAGCGSSSAKSAGGGASSAPAGASPTMSVSAAGGSTTKSGNVTINVKNFAFSPMDMTVAVGTKVTWKFEDSAAHTVKAKDGSFASPSLKNGQTFEHTFTKAGSFPYICSIHNYMTAMITVK